MRLSHSISGAIRTFSYFMASGSHYMLEGVDYLPLYGEEPSVIEQAYAIFINTLELDSEGNILNFAHAQKRATEYIRAYCDASYQIELPLEDWEAELY